VKSVMPRTWIWRMEEKRKIETGGLGEVGPSAEGRGGGGGGGQEGS